MPKEIIKSEGKMENLAALCWPIAPENQIGRLSRMEAINNKAINEARHKHAEDKMRQLKLALNRIED